jgi:tripartite-type tricarboxylate transporter receptor subunit TctC
VLLLAGCGIATPVMPAAPSHPSRPLHLVVPYPAGGGADFWGRLIAAKIEEALGATVVVENMPGSGGDVGTAAVARAPADGYTLLLGSVGPLAVHPFTYTKLAFDPSRDFVPVSLLESSPLLLVVHPRVRASSLADLIALAKAQPESLSLASNGNGSPEHVASEILERREGGRGAAPRSLRRRRTGEKEAPGGGGRHDVRPVEGRAPGRPRGAATNPRGSQRRATPHVTRNSDLR